MPDDDPHLTVADYEHEGWWSDVYGWQDGDETPTHWMPLPDGPNAERGRAMNNTQYLITYRSEFGGVTIYGMMIADDPIEWLAETQEDPETYILLNAQPLYTVGFLVSCMGKSEGNTFLLGKA
jgi:hypothetical protein